MSGGDGYLTNPLYREIAKMMTDAGITHRVEQGAKHFKVKFLHCGVEREQILHLGPNNKGSTYRKTILRFRKIVAAERAYVAPQSSPELNLEQPAMSEPAQETAKPSFDLALHVVDDEPRVLDTDIARRLGYARFEKIRELIARNEDELRRYGNLPHRGVNAGGRGRPSTAFYLNEPQAVLLCLRSDAPSAPDAREVVINTFMAVRRGQLAPAIATVDAGAIAKEAAKLAGGAAGGAAKNAVVPHIHHFEERVETRLTKQAAWMQESNRDLHNKIDGLLSLITSPSAVSLQANDYIEIGGVYEVAGLTGPVARRGLLSANMRRALDDFCLDRRILPMHARVRGQKIRHWPKATVADWLAAEGHALIERHMRANAPRLAVVHRSNNS